MTRESTRREFNEVESSKGGLFQERTAGRLFGSFCLAVQGGLFSRALAADGRNFPYGLGWFVQDRNGVCMLWHYGWWVGSSSIIIKVPERRLTFVLLANSDMLSRKFDLGRDEDVLRSTLCPGIRGGLRRRAGRLNLPEVACRRVIPPDPS